MTEEMKERLDGYKQLIMDKTGDKYNYPGIYAIYINDILVYIGKSKNVLHRISSHMYNTLDYGDKAHKYDVLREAKARKLPIRFDLLEKVEDIDEDQMIEDIGYLEGVYIRETLPPLNQQIPKEDDWHKFTINKRANIISLDQILEEG